MVKADSSRDYYADLELTPNASIDDIKRQFKKLALKYHPDRNPGKELEFNPKFQAIQAAHEVLGDPQQKAKYDADRRKYLASTGFPRQPAPRYRDPTADVPFPPPPSRKPRESESKPKYASTPSSGADRFSNFPQPSSSGRSSANQDAQARANTFKAWQNLNPQTRTSHWSNRTPQASHWPNPTPQAQPPPRTQASPSAQNARTRPTGGTEEPPLAKSRTTPDIPPRQAPSSSNWEKPRSAWEEVNGARPGVGRSASTKAPKRAGFDPTAPGSADEGQARATSGYTRTARYDGPPLPPMRDFPPPPPGPPPFVQRPASGLGVPLGHSRSNEEDVPFAEGTPRVRTPYVSHIGERTYLSSDALKRSASTRDATREDPPKSKVGTQGMPSNTGRYRSASPTSRKAFSNDSSSTKPQPETNSRSSRSRDKPTRPSHSGNARRPFVLDSDSEESDAVSEEEMTHHHFRRPKAPSDPFKGGLSSEQSTNGTYHGQANGMEGKTGRNMYDDLSAGDNQPSSASAASKWARLWPFGSQKYCDSEKAARPPYWAFPSSVLPARRRTTRLHCLINPTVPPAPFLFKAQGLSQCPAMERTYHAQDEANYIYPFSFSFPLNPTIPPTNSTEFRSRSTEEINTKFSASDWNGTFTGIPDVFAGAPPPMRRNSGQRVSPSRGRPRPAPSVQSMNGGQNNASAEMPPPPRPVKVPSAVEQPGEVKFSAEEWQKTFKDASWTYPTPGQSSPTRPGSASSSRARSRPIRKPSKSSVPSTTVPKPVTVEEVRDDTEPATANGRTTTSGASSGSESDVNAMDIDTPPANPAGSTSYSVPSEPRLVSVEADRPEWRVSGRQRAQTEAAPGSRPTSAAEGPNLSEFKNVAPLAPSNNEGVRNLKDLETTLPFTSQSSPHRPEATLTPETQLQLPQPPKAPTLPTKLTKQIWGIQLALMNAYMTHWHTFESKIIAHFEERLRLQQHFHSWLNEFGDAGYDRYVKEFREDEVVREHWGVARERHRGAVEAWARVKDRVRREGLRG